LAGICCGNAIVDISIGGFDGDVSTEHMIYALNVTHVFVTIGTNSLGRRSIGMVLTLQYLDFGTARYFCSAGSVSFSWNTWIYTGGVIG
jgi:hypothetical protein